MDESEELPQILHPLVNDGPPALTGRSAQVSCWILTAMLHRAAGDLPFGCRSPYSCAPHAGVVQNDQEDRPIRPDY